jgi:hypothetical protein
VAACARHIPPGTLFLSKSFIKGRSKEQELSKREFVDVISADFPSLKVWLFSS